MLYKKCDINRLYDNISTLRALPSTPISAVGALFAALLVVPIVLASQVATAEAQETAVLVGEVVSEETGEPVAGASIRLRGTDRGAYSRQEGTFHLGSLGPGTYVVETSALGFRSASREVTLTADETNRVRFELAPRPIEMSGIEVSVLRPDMQPESELDEREVRESNPKDSGDVLRRLPGVDAVRRGPLGLDPSVRGLRETEVGTYMDGTRMFPAGPARMDSPLTHFDPSAISSIQVVKGPYALTWGAGNLSAIRVETRDLPASEDLRGRLATGYDSNLDAAETVGTASGRSGDVAYWVHGVWRDGGDYESGGGAPIDGDFRSWESRAKLGVDLTESSRIVLSGGYQDQGPVDYPGRLLQAEFFETRNLSGRYHLQPADGPLRDLEIMGYFNGVDHGMTNDGKPTSEPMEGRTPPFALDVGVDSEIDVYGGRAAATLGLPPGWTVEVGGDVYSADRSAVRTIRRADDGSLLFDDLMWPDATITDGGVFGRVARAFGGSVRATGTVRVDLVEATADTASEFFLENASSDLESTETNLSAAATLGVDLSSAWALSAGVGTAVRTADATERYSDRIPATKAQTSAEFMGNPRLEPERSNQVDLWLDGQWEELALQLNVFGRKMENYITLEPTELPKRLPLSPDTVFRYVNGEATFYGFEASGALGLTDALVLQLGSSYLWGKDDTLDEPALGVPPLRGSAGLRYERPDGRFFVEGTVHAVDEKVASQDPDANQVALSRGEGGTPGYLTADLRGGVRLVRGLDLRAGVENLTDRDFVNHLNARNPFTGQQVPEPGRVLFVDLAYEF